MLFLTFWADGQGALKWMDLHDIGTWIFVGLEFSFFSETL